MNLSVQVVCESESCKFCSSSPPESWRARLEISVRTGGMAGGAICGKASLRKLELRSMATILRRCAPQDGHPSRMAATAWVSFMVKLLRAYGGCLGARRRRRTWQAAKSLGELQASFDPGVSEWGNPC